MLRDFLTRTSINTEHLLVVATQTQLQWIMSHRNTDIYQAYINERVQRKVQVVFFGCPWDDALYKVVIQISRYADPHTQTKPASEENRCH